MKPVVAALALFATSIPASALACSCMEIGGTWFTAPSDGAVNVPTNALVWVGGGITRGLYAGEQRHAIEVFGPDETTLPGTDARLRGGFELLDVFTPDFEFAPNTTYSIRVNGEIYSTFATGAEADTEPPAQPSQMELSTWSDPPFIPDGGMCGDGSASHGISVQWGLGDGIVVLMDNDERADVDVDAIEGSAPSLSTSGYTSIGKGFGCGGDNWDGARNGAQTQIRAGSYDIAGNFSGWTESETAVVRPRPPAGCSAAGTASPSLAFLLVLGGVLLRRRD